MSGRPGLESRFEERARGDGKRSAVVSGDRVVSYEELDELSEGVAGELERLGVGPGSRVGLCVESGLGQVVTMLGVLKAGASYVPVDLASPASRRELILDDARPEVVIGEGEWEGMRGERRRRGRGLEGGWREAYVIYTSGSTGRPKGVMVTHENVVRLFGSLERTFGLGPGDVWSYFHSFAFDFSVWELWGALLYGGSVVVVPGEVKRSPEQFRELLRREGVTVLSQTPSAFRQLVEVEERSEGKLEELRAVVFGGEALRYETLRGWLEKYGDERPELHNLYGITETTVHVTERRVRRGDVGGPSVVGRAIEDLELRLLGAGMEEVGAGEVGEIHVGGAGVTLGYLGKPGLTAERFVPDPWGEGGRLYRSGDLGRWLGEGELEYVGRGDQQVKVRGHRVELGEIENALLAHPDVVQAAARTFPDAAGQAVIALYAVPRPGSTPPDWELREFLRQRLPDPMQPGSITIMAALPLTGNGKVDRAALPPPDLFGPALSRSFAAPRTDVERALAAVIAEVLGIRDVGVDDNLFELGCDSMRTVQIVAVASSSGLRLKLQDLYRHPTVGRLAEVVSGR